MRHKLMQAHPLGGFKLDDDLGGERRKSSPRSTPRATLAVKLTVVEGFRLTEIAAWAQQHLNSGTLVLSDGLACFNGVTAAGREPNRRRESRGRASSFDG